MKRKIQHDAVNNQEDEDSSTYPIGLLFDETSDKNGNKSVKNNVVYFSGKTSNDKDELTSNYTKV
jgi:hypothetical protein